MRIGHGISISDVINHYKEKTKEVSDVIEFCLNNQNSSKVGFVEINDNFILLTVAQFLDGRVVFSLQRLSRNGFEILEHELWKDKPQFLIDEPAAVLRIFPEINKSQWFDNDGSIFDYLYDLKKKRKEEERNKILR
jgi:hypothetical protein